jgi:hypothetical protein
MATPSATELLIRQVADETARRAVESTLITLGIDQDNPLETQRDMAALRELRELVRDEEFQKDLAYLRAWRLAMSHMQNKGLLTLVGIIMAGIVAAVIAGVRSLF